MDVAKSFVEELMVLSQTDDSAAYSLCSSIFIKDRLSSLTLLSSDLLRHCTSVDDVAKVAAFLAEVPKMFWDSPIWSSRRNERTEAHAHFDVLQSRLYREAASMDCFTVESLRNQLLKNAVDFATSAYEKLKGTMKADDERLARNNLASALSKSGDFQTSHSHFSGLIQNERDDENKNRIHNQMIRNLKQWKEVDPASLTTDARNILNRLPSSDTVKINKLEPMMMSANIVETWNSDRNIFI
jgi:hypothetical protein